MKVRERKREERWKKKHGEGMLSGGKRKKERSRINREEGRGGENRKGGMRW